MKKEDTTTAAKWREGITTRQQNSPTIEETRGGRKILQKDKILRLWNVCQTYYSIANKKEYIKLITSKNTFPCSFAGNPLSDRICICTGFPFPKVLFATFCNAAGEITSIFGQH